MARRSVGHPDVRALVDRLVILFLLEGSVNGVQRLIGPSLGAYLGSAVSRRAVLVIGGLMVLLAAHLARRQAEDEKVDGRYPTFADLEPEPDAPLSQVQDPRSSASVGTGPDAHHCGQIHRRI